MMQVPGSGDTRPLKTSLGVWPSMPAAAVWPAGVLGLKIAVSAGKSLSQRDRIEHARPGGPCQVRP